MTPCRTDLEEGESRPLKGGCAAGAFSQEGKVATDALRRLSVRALGDRQTHSPNRDVVCAKVTRWPSPIRRARHGRRACWGGALRGAANGQRRWHALRPGLRVGLAKDFSERSIAWGGRHGQRPNTDPRPRELAQGAQHGFAWAYESESEPGPSSRNLVHSVRLEPLTSG